MSTINGTNVAATIRPFDTNDNFPTTYADEAKGGLHIVSAHADLLTIPYARREIGMKVVVTGEAYSVYTLIDDNKAATTVEADWEKIPVKASEVNVTNSDGTVTPLSDTITKIKSSSDYRYVVFCLQPVEVGVSPVEIMLPFAGAIESITANSQSTVALTKDIDIDLETSTGAWTKAATVVISNTSATKSGTVTLSTPLPVAATAKLRCNITSVTDKIDSLQVVVTIKQS